MTAPLPVDRAGAADRRDSAADLRDDLADERDEAGDLRDDAADDRDVASGRRDRAAAHRDATADLRDADADAREHPDAAPHSAVARRAAASDRQRSSQDRAASAGERQQAGRDRSTAEHDRDVGASERDRAGEDRDASARDREDASLDSLTGAYVRGPGMLQLDREVQRAQRASEQLTVAFVDVDHLKAVNDAGGHAAGDALLIRVAAALRDRLRSYDLVIRYGGDEFVCVLPGLSWIEAEQRFALVNADLERHGSVTVGAVTAEPDERAADLISRADAALYARRALRVTPAASWRP